MRFDIITIFPSIFDSYFNESILARARKNKLIEINIHNLRDYTTNKRRTIDDTPYGGGAGMVLKIEPIWRCVQFLKSKIKIKNKKSRIILFSAKGKKFTQEDARRLIKYNRLIMICGRYEGVDERVAQYIADEEISIGDYVLMGGELPAMIIVDAVSRLTPGAVGKSESIQDESFKKIVKKVPISKACLRDASGIQVSIYLEYPHYTKPEVFSPNKKINWRVPKILLSGNHERIKQWREEHSKRLF